MSVGNRLPYRGGPENWLLAPEYPLNVEDLLWPLFTLRAGVIPGVFAERTFFAEIVRIDKPLQDDLSVRRQLESCEIALEDFAGFLPKRADDVVFIDLSSHERRRDEKMDCVHAYHRGSRHFGAVLFVLVKMEVRVLPLDNLNTAVITIMDLHS